MLQIPRELRVEKADKRRTTYDTLGVNLSDDPHIDEEV